MQHDYRGLCMLPALADAAVIFDEIHSYDTVMWQSLVDFLSAFDVPVLCMTATLPPGRRDDLKDLLDLTDSWVKGVPGEAPSPPTTAPDPATLRFCGGVVREAVFGLLEEVIQEVEEDAGEEPSPTVPDYAERAVRGLALYLWRVWTLVTALRQDPPPAQPLEDLWQNIDHQLQRTADRILRAAERTGRCAVQEGCGRAHETAASAPPNPDAFQALIAQLAALGAAWQDEPPVSHRAAGDALASLLREHGALHEQGAPGLCAACRAVFLGFLRALSILWRISTPKNPGICMFLDSWAIPTPACQKISGIL